MLTSSEVLDILKAPGGNNVATFSQHRLTITRMLDDKLNKRTPEKVAAYFRHHHGLEIPEQAALLIAQSLQEFHRPK